MKGGPLFSRIITGKCSVIGGFCPRLTFYSQFVHQGGGGERPGLYSGCRRQPLYTHRPHAFAINRAPQRGSQYEGGPPFFKNSNWQGRLPWGVPPTAHVLKPIRAPRRGRGEARATFRMSATATIHAQASRVCSKSGATEGGAI